MTRPAIDLVAVAYKAPAETLKFCRSLRHVGVPFTMTFIDNAFADGDSSALDVIKDELPHIRSFDECVQVNLYASARNVGYARACNQGATYGSAPYLALLNCDVQMRPDVVPAIVARFDDHPDVGIVGPRQLDSRNRLTHSGIVADRLGRDQHRYWMQPDTPAAHDVFDVPTVSGSAFFVRRKMWSELTRCGTYRKVAPDATGAFLPTPHYFEETFCAYHARSHGWRVVYDGTVFLIHEWHRSSPVGSEASDGRWNVAKGIFLDACKAHDIGANP